MKICIWFDFNLLGFKISLLWICKDTAYNSWLVSGNWQMNNGWRLYLYLSITDRNLHIFSPPHSSAPLDFLPTPCFTVVNNLHELTGASGHFRRQFIGLLCITLRSCLLPPPETLSSLGFGNITLTCIWSSSLALPCLLCRFLCWLLNGLYLRAQWWIPFSSERRWRVFSSSHMISVSEGLFWWQCKGAVWGIWYWRQTGKFRG